MDFIVPQTIYESNSCKLQYEAFFNFSNMSVFKTPILRQYISRIIDV